MKKISTLCLTLVMLLMVMIHVAPNAQAVEGEQASLTYTIVNETNPNGTNSATVAVTLGNEVGISLGVNEQFGYYIHAGDMITDANQKFIASASNHVVVVMKETELDTVATFVDTNGEFLGAIYNPTLASEGLDISVSKPGFDFVGFDKLEAGVDKVYVAKYSRTNQEAINVNITGGTKDLEDVQYNDVVTLTPDTGNFSYWVDEDGQVVSKNANYTFTALQNVELTAVFDDPAPSEPVVYLSNVTGISPDTKSFLGYVEGDFIEYGLLASDKEEVLTLETEDVTVIPSKALHPETNEFLRSIPNDTNLKSFRAYAKLANGEVYYSENNFLSGGGSYIADMENASKNGYAIGTVNINGNNWNFNDSLIDTSNADLKNGQKSARVRNGFIELLTPVVGLTHISFYHGNYGSDSSGALKLEIKLDGSSWQTVDSSITVGSNSLEYYNIELDDSFGITTSSSVYVKISNVSGNSGNRINIDDIKLESILKTKLYNVEFIDGEVKNPTHVIYKAPAVAPTLSKTGHTFAGWYTSPLFEENTLFDLNTGISKHMTLFAKWSPNTYTASFELNGGNQSTDYDPIEYVYGTSFEQPTDPTREGYEFAGWYSNSNFTTIYTGWNGSRASNHTIFAKWEPAQYTITFNTDGGSVVDPITQAYLSEVNEPIAPSKEGYGFIGWYDLNNELVIWPYIMPLGGTELRAEWQIISTHTITFDSNFDDLEDPIAQSLDTGEFINEPDITVPEGYRLVGWSLTDEEPYDFWSFDTPVNADIHLIAIWTEKIPSETYVETFNQVTVTGSSYTAEDSYTDSNGFNWSMRGRGDQTLVGKAWTLGNAADNSFVQVTATNGISSFSLDVVRAFTNSNARTLELFINDVSFGTFSVDTKSDVSQLWEVDNINITGNVTIKVVSINTGSRGATIVDNFTWTTNPQ